MGINVFRMRAASILPCKGFDTSSSNGKTACPHVPGVCLTDEEQYMGECFEKCSKLTNGVYPNRVAVATCCKTGGIACLDPFNDLTSPKLDVGGGTGDHDSATPHSVHRPLKSLTEVKNTSPAPTPSANTRRAPPTKITPDENLHDNNPCDGSEELYLGLCYTKCAVLTGGRY